MVLFYCSATGPEVRRVVACHIHSAVLGLKDIYDIAAKGAIWRDVGSIKLRSDLARFGIGAPCVSGVGS